MRIPTHVGNVVTWADLSDAEPEGEWVNLGEMTRKTMSVEGGSVRLMGRNREADPEGFDLLDAHGFPIKGPGLVELSACPLHLRPVQVRIDH
jgi:hypothetical protein